MSLRSMLPTIFFTLLHLYTQGTQANPNFNQGLSLFQKGQFNEAKTEFETALSQNPSNVHILYNLGLTESKLGQNGRALALWRKALYISPTFSQARRAIEYNHEKMKVRAIPRQITLRETLRNGVLGYLSFSLLFFISGVSLFLTGWFWIQFFARKKRFSQGEGAAPGIPWLASTLAVFALAAITLTTFKVIDYTTPRATVIVEKVDAKTAPGANQATLFELYEGLEVIVREQFTEAESRWVQVSYPGGMTGWVPLESLMHSSGKTPW